MSLVTSSIRSTFPNVNNPDGAYQLFRNSDAAASRNIPAVIHDSLRLCREL